VGDRNVPCPVMAKFTMMDLDMIVFAPHTGLTAEVF
jgi:hypothetical protein